MENDNNPIPQDEIRKEFQIERMILFSDAVFAIVITLMAIEIRFPEAEGHEPMKFGSNMMHVLPVILAYAVSFLFIGAIWYQHLKVFSLIRDYDQGLVVRNLILLFFVGLFPFSASVISHAEGNFMAAIFYFIIIQLCMLAQMFLHQYILIKKPELRVSKVDPALFDKLSKNKGALVSMFLLTILMVITANFIENPKLQGMSMMWMAVFPVFFKVFHKYFKKREMK